jgi:ParB family chromosome partitioning protein
MAKLDELMKASRAVAAESMGVARPATPMHGASPGPTSQIPDRLKGVARSKNAAEIPIDRIGPDPDQPREEFEPEALDRLAESLKVRGQLQPIRVRWDEGREQYVIICGERRWRAARQAGLTTMSCVITDGPIDAGEMLALQMIENCVREDLQPIEQAKAFRALIERNNWSARQVARELGIVQSNVVRALALLDLPSVVQDQVEQGSLPPATAYEVSKLEDPEAQAEVAARVIAEGLSRAETVEEVRRVASRPDRIGESRSTKGRGAIKARPRRPTVRIIRTATAKVTVEFRKAVELSEVIAVLEESLAKLRLETSAERAA